MTSTIIALTAIYSLFGLILFAYVWEEMEKEVIGISDKPRLFRISIRLCIIILWPILLYALFARVLVRALVHFWNSLTE